MSEPSPINMKKSRRKEKLTHAKHWFSQMEKLQTNKVEESSCEKNIILPRYILKNLRRLFILHKRSEIYQDHEYHYDEGADLREELIMDLWKLTKLKDLPLCTEECPEKNEAKFECQKCSLLFCGVCFDDHTCITSDTPNNKE